MIGSVVAALCASVFILGTIGVAVWVLADTGKRLERLLADRDEFLND